MREETPVEVHGYRFRLPVEVAYIFTAGLVASLIRSGYRRLVIRFSKNPWRVCPLIEKIRQERDEQASDRRTPDQPTYGDY